MLLVLFFKYLTLDKLLIIATKKNSETVVIIKLMLLTLLHRNSTGKYHFINLKIMIKYHKPLYEL